MVWTYHCRYTGCITKQIFNGFAVDVSPFVVDESFGNFDLSLPGLIVNALCAKSSLLVVLLSHEVNTVL